MHLSSDPWSGSVAMYTAPPLDIRPEVAVALQAGRPVVALTSAPIAHSLPWPENLETVRLIEAAVREEHAVLAVIAVWHGRLTVGLTAKEVEALAGGKSTLRANRRDLATAVTRGLTAATTVSASMYLAARAGIPLLVTGAIGGAAASGDELGRLCRLGGVVSYFRGRRHCRARSVADLAHTAEILESYSVPVVGYGTDSFPAFYQRPGSQPASVRSR